MWFFSYAVERTIIPEAATQAVDAQPGKVWDKYNERAFEMQEYPGGAFASWAFTWTTIMNYMKYLVRFLSWIGLVIWAVMIIYWWYKYAIWVFTGQATTGNEPIKLAIQWVLVIIFSYAIIKFILASIWGVS